MTSQSPQLPTTPIVAETETVWGQPLRPVGCAQCHQTFLVKAERLGQRCPYCARDTLSPQPALMRHEPPELCLSFQFTRHALRPILQTFIHPVWCKPRELNVDTLLQRITVVYWSQWLVDSTVVGDWQCEVGFDYQVKSSQEHYRD